MSVNSSSSSNTSLPPSSVANMYRRLNSCFRSTAGTVSITTFAVTSILLLLPLCTFILHLGLQRQRRQHSNTQTSHSDLFTYHMVSMELLSVLGVVFICCSVHTDLPQMMKVGVCLFIVNSTGQMIFHILTCAERYLAVVHPITYLSLRKVNGIRIRNATIGGVWLLSFASAALPHMDEESLGLLFLCVIVVNCVVVSFCSLAVLCVLIRPGPGEGGGAKQRDSRRQVDQSKLRAFYTIMAILGALLLRFGGHTITTALSNSSQVETQKCSLWLSTNWISLPSSLVLPLLYLHRAGKLLCCKNNDKSGPGSD